MYKSLHNTLLAAEQKEQIMYLSITAYIKYINKWKLNNMVNKYDITFIIYNEVININ